VRERRSGGTPARSASSGGPGTCRSTTGSCAPRTRPRCAPARARWARSCLLRTERRTARAGGGRAAARRNHAARRARHARAGAPMPPARLPTCTSARQRFCQDVRSAFEPCAVNVMQARDRRMQARAGTGLSGTCAQRTHCPHAARGRDANARDSRHIQVTLRAAPRRRCPWPGRATSCARAACCRPGPATHWCWAPRPSARLPASYCMRRRRRRAPAGGCTTLAAYLRRACTAVAALLRDLAVRRQCRAACTATACA